MKKDRWDYKRLPLNQHIPRVLIAHSIDDVLQDAHVRRESAALDFGAKVIAEDPSEVFVPCVRQETP